MDADADRTASRRSGSEAKRAKVSALVHKRQYPILIADMRGIMDDGDLEYLRSRVRAERAAAKSARCPEARRVHQELAASYGALVEQQNALPQRQRLTIPVHTAD